MSRHLDSQEDKKEIYMSPLCASQKSVAILDFVVSSDLKDSRFFFCLSSTFRTKEEACNYCISDRFESSSKTYLFDWADVGPYR